LKAVQREFPAGWPLPLKGLLAVFAQLPAVA
jgi:hypothetical protein